MFRKLDSYVQKNETMLPYYTTQKNNSIWNKDYYVKPETIKSLEENIDNMLLNISPGKEVLELISKAKAKKQK